MALTTPLKAILAVLLILLIISTTAFILYLTERRRRLHHRHHLSQNSNHHDFTGIDPVLGFDDPYPLVSHMHSLDFGPYPRTGTLRNAHPQHMAPAHVHVRAAVPPPPPPPYYSSKAYPHFGFPSTHQNQHQDQDQSRESSRLAHAHYAIDNAAGRDLQLCARSNTNPEMQFVLLAPPPPRSARRGKKGKMGKGNRKVSLGEASSREEGGGRGEEYVDVELGRA